MDKVKKKLLSSMLESFINGNVEQSEVEFHNFLNLKTKEMIIEKKECDDEDEDEDDDSDEKDEDDDKETSKKKKKFEKFKKDSDEDEDEDEDEKPKKKEKKLKEGLNQPIAGSVSSAIKGKINLAPKKPRAKKVKSL